MRNQQKPETIADYSTELKKRLTGILPPERIEEVVAETESHLEDRTDELVQSRRAAEARAVAEFVPPKRLATGINRAWATVYLRHRGTNALQWISAAISGIALLWALSCTVIIAKLPPVMKDQGFFIPIFCCIPFLVFLIALASCRSQVRRFTIGAAIYMVICMTAGGLFCSNGVVSRFDAPEHYRRNLEAKEDTEKELRLLHQGIRFYREAVEKPEFSLSYTKALIRQIHTLKRSSKERSRKDQEDRLAELLLQKADLQARYFSISPNYMPDELKYGNRLIVPISQWSNGGTSAFKSVGSSEMKTLPASMAGEAAILWHDDALKHRVRLQERETWLKSVLKSDLALMASPKWRLDIASVRVLGSAAAVGSGTLIFADLLGGLAGGFLLRSLRRRRPNGKELAR